MKKLFLLDAYALIFRAYYAFISRPVKNSKGFNTSAVYGFTNTLDEVLRKEKPTHIAVVFDPPMPCFRKLIYEDYKANRLNTPEDIKWSVPYIKDIIRAFNIPVLEVDGFEADDVIGTVARKAEEEGFEVYIMTPDKDLSQMISENIFLYKPRRSGGEADIVGLGGIRELFEIEDPRQVIDVLALWGDSSDNVPGAPGIGEKTAKSLVSKYQNIEGIYNNIHELKGRVKDSLLNYKNQVEMAKVLVTVRTDVPIECDFKTLEVTAPDYEKLNGLFTELEFRTLISRIIGNKQVQPAAMAVQGSLFESNETGTTVPMDMGYNKLSDTEYYYNLANTSDQLNHLFNILQDADEFSFDTETDSLNINRASLVGMSFSVKPHEAYYIHFPDDRGETLNILSRFREFFEDPYRVKIGQNIKFDVQVLSTYGIHVKGKIFDTMIAHYLIQPEMPHNMDFLARNYLKYSPVPIEALIGPKGNGQLNMRMVNTETIKDYCCEDADITLQLSYVLREELKKYQLEKLAYEVEMPLICTLAEMEQTGFKINTKELDDYAKVLNSEISIIENKIFELAGCQFNISSPKQLGEILFEKLNISGSGKRTKTKQYSTSEEELLKLKDKHEIVEKVLEYRMLKKLVNTYVEALPKLISHKTGKIHTCFEQAWVATGRLSSKSPNLQNIPIREERGREIRKSFIPSGDDYCILSADYSQIELRLMAHMSGDENMIEAFLSGEDIHSATAAKIYNMPLSEVTKDMRRNAKTANFGIIYGISAFGLSQRLGISRTEAKELIDGYFDSYKKVKRYMENSVQSAKEKGYVETLLGRRRYLKEIHSANAVVRGNAERNAINAPLQGSAADIIKMAMVNIQARLRGNFRTKMILQVHDELVFDVFIPELETVQKMVKEEMENVIQLSVPLLVEMGTGKNWLEAH